MNKICVTENLRLSYRVEGQGIPVVLLHGFGEDSHIWDEQIQALSSYCTLLVPQFPGTGDSLFLNQTNITVEGTAVQIPSLSIMDLADSIYAMLVQEKVSSCIMLGHSMGGYVCLAFAEKYPQLLHKFGLIHSTAFADSAEKKQNRLRGIELMQQYGGYAFLKNTIPNLFGDTYKQQNPEQVANLIAASEAFATSSLQQYYYAMMQRPDRTAILKGNPLPVLFVLGTEDVAAPLNDVLQQTHLPLISYIHILNGVGHMGMWEATATVNRHILAFIHH